MKAKTWLLLALVLALSLVCCGTAAADSPVPALTVDGKTEDITLEFNEAPVTRVMVPETATALIVEAERISGGDEYQQWSEAYDRYRIAPCNEMYRTFYDSGVWQVAARYTTDDYQDGTDLYEAELNWISLGTVEVTVKQWIERLSAPDITLSAASVTQGEWLWVTVNNFQQKNYWYELACMNDSSGEWEWIRHEDAKLKAGLADTFAIPTLDLAPGTYRLWLRTEAVSYEDNGVYKVFTVSENSAPTDGLSLSASSVPVSVPVYVGMRAAGADRMSLSLTLEEDPYWWNRWEINGECDWRWFDLDRPGTFHLTLTAWENDVGSVVGEATLIVTAQSYLADPVYTDFPGVLSAGEDLNGTLTLDGRTERYYVELHYCPDDGEWISLFRTDRGPVAPSAETLSLPASLFTREGRYRIHVHAYAMGVDSSYNEYWFLRSDSGGTVGLTINGETGGVTVPSSEDVQIRVTAPNATAARVLFGDHWEYRGSPRDFSFYTSFGSGDYALVAQITTDEPVWNENYFDWGSFRWETDVNWEDCSNTVFLHVRDTYGRLAQPAVTLESDSVSQGEWLRASVSGQDHGEWYWAQIRRMWRDEYGNLQSEHVMDCDGNGSDGFAFPAALLQPGEYYLTVGADAVGWKSAEKSVPFTVTEGETDDLALIFASDTILTSQDINFFACAAGADRMSVEVTWNRDSNWRNYYEGYGEQNCWRWAVSDAGVYTFTLSAWQGGNSLGQTSFTLTVDAPYGDLREPVAEALPAVMETGTAIDTAFSVDENAGSVGVQLIYYPDNGDWEYLVDEWRPADQPGAGALSFPAEYFSRPGFYRLELHITGTGWNGAHMNRVILVTEPTQQGLSLSVNNGSDEDIYLHMYVPVTVDVPEGVTAVRLWSSSYDWWDCRAAEGGSMEWYWGFHRGGEEILLAQATTDPSVTEWLNDPNHDGMQDFDWSTVDWTMSSAPVTVTVIYYGELDDPEVSFPDGASVERGETLRLQVSPVENAYGFGVQVRRAGDEDWNLLADMEYDFADGGTVLLPTDAFEPGEYVVNIDPRRYGWNGNSVAYPFTVTQPASWSDEPVFRVVPSEIETREHITYSIYAPGAQQVMICNEAMENDWNRSWGESLLDHVMLNWAKVYHLYAYAFYPGDGESDGEWRQVGYAEVNVTAPNGAVEVAVDAPARVASTEEWTLSLLCDFKGTDGSAECYLTSAARDMEIAPELLSVTDEGDLKRFTFRVEANSLQVGPYYLTAYAFPGAPGYELGIGEGMVEISDGSLDAQLTVSPNPAELFDDLEITLYAPGATAVALWSEMNGMSWICEPGDTLHDTQTAWEDGSGLVYGLYTTEAIDPDEPGFDWNDVHWEGMSNTVTVTVNPPSGVLEELDVAVLHSTVRRGERLIVSILNENPGLDVNYGAHLTAIDPGENDFGYPWFAPGPDGKTIRVDTLLVPPGDYLLEVSAAARGCRPVMTAIPVSVTEGELTVLTLPAGLKSIETEAFANVAAEKIVIPDGVETIASNAFTDCPNLVELVLPEGISSFAPDALGTTGPVYVFGQEGSCQQAYAEFVDNLVFVPTD